ncbi:MAG: ATP-binding protein, partial [Actinomycetota bacterium]|nr:ATP-binding protein [Actinomycetota bacterium]
MSFLSIPNELRNLLAGSALEAATLDVVEKAGTILDANELNFFPAYTDHGTQHVNQVLDAIVLLIPDEVLEEGMLSAADASVLICGALFHDLALHIHDQGFVQLVGGETAHSPLQWFDVEQVDRSPDLPWPILWANFQAEAQHFGTSQLELMLGPAGNRVPRVAYEDPLRPERWVQSDRLLIGEFLRRHHGRLSHEIAMYGFPGACAERFPVLKKTMPGLANAIGVVARSHQEPLRRMLEYLAYWEPGTETPGGAFLPYSMALLRIADYFQIDADRAPPLLLRLKAPLSPRSIEQWDQHRAILGISSRHDDLFAVHIRVSPEHGLRTHLALKALFEDMQQELDTTTAVLSEKYAKTDLAPLRLTKQRIRTNLDTASMHAQLPYVPRRASLQSDTDLFRLVINDLYGNRPAVAGRELIQNAVDAVRARRSFEKHSARLLLPGEMKELEADVVVSIEQGEGDQLILRIADRGIGMTPETVIDSYLQAGASFRPTAAERVTDGSAGEEPLRAGRFGIGAFAGFLLGPEIKVTTRHPETEKGLSFAAR